MAFDYAQARLTAQKIIAKFGQPHNFYTPAIEGGMDRFGNSTPDTPQVNYSGIVSPKLGYKSQEIDGEQILNGDSFVFFHTDTVPPIGSFVDLNGDTYRVVNFKRLDSVDNINVYIKLQVRR